MILMFTMAGESSRFSRVGYYKKKYMLNAGGKSLFYRTVFPFTQYIDDISEFIFVVLKQDDCEKWLGKEVDLLGIKNYRIVTLDKPTRGQAHTANIANYKAAPKLDEFIFIMNIDTVIHNPKLLQMQKIAEGSTGIIDVAELPGDNWSFVEPAKDKKFVVNSFLEKQKVSELASTGLYGFSSVETYQTAFENMSNDKNFKTYNLEQYISNVYQYLIKEDETVLYHENQGEISLSGTPCEYRKYCLDNDWTPESPES